MRLVCQRRERVVAHSTMKVYKNLMRRFKTLSSCYCWVANSLGQMIQGWHILGYVLIENLGTHFGYKGGLESAQNISLATQVTTQHFTHVEMIPTVKIANPSKYTIAGYAMTCLINYPTLLGKRRWREPHYWVYLKLRLVKEVARALTKRMGNNATNTTRVAEKLQEVMLQLQVDPLNDQLKYSNNQQRRNFLSYKQGNYSMHNKGHLSIGSPKEIKEPRSLQEKLKCDM